MDDRRFDALTRVLAGVPSRRAVLSGLAGLLGGTITAGDGAGAAPVSGKACVRPGKKCKPRKKRCCGNATCRNGRCQCPARQKQCGTTCIPKSACCRDAECGGGGICRDRECVCPPGMKDCQGTCIAQRDCCTSAECGACESCVEGRCRSGCQPGQECQEGTCVCTTASCAGCCAGDRCREGDSDRACGVGGVSCQTCGDHADCTDGACVCDPDFTPCEDPPVCVNTRSNRRHCGECGVECGENEVCARGRCQCDDGFKPCDDECIAESECCGGCDPTEECVDGSCQPLPFCRLPGNETAVCTTYPQGPVRCCDETCPPEPTCLGNGTTCTDGADGTCRNCCGAASCDATTCRCSGYQISAYAAGRPLCATDRECNGTGVELGECRCGECCLGDGEAYTSTPLNPCKVCCSGQCHSTGGNNYTCGPA